MGELRPIFRVSPFFNKPMSKKLAMEMLAAPAGTCTAEELAHANGFLASCGKKA